MKEEIELVATTLFGVEKFVGEEIDALGYTRVETTDGRVTFRAPLEGIARANLFLRCAERVCIHMGSFTADTFDSLFEGTKALPWERWIGPDDAFPVTGHSVRSQLFSVPDCQKIIKKAIVERLKGEYGISLFSEEEAKVQIRFFLYRNKATLLIDTSGDALFKRGYRTRAGKAPLRETLAAALCRIARPREDVLFWDPFCGSGTIVIEAMMRMNHIAPGLHRRFAAEQFLDLSPDLWRRAREEARDLQVRCPFEARGTDIDPAMIEIAKANALRAGITENLTFSVKNALDITTENRRGTIVCNPPYGQRLDSVREAKNLYRAMGERWKNLDRWQIYVLSDSEEFPRLYGRRPDLVRKLYNGMIPCFYYQFFRSEKKV